MRIRALATAALLGSVAAASPAPLFAQLVPVTHCNAAIPCNIPYGLRPWRAANWTPGASWSMPSAAISVFSPIDQGLSPRIVTRPVADDPAETAARMYVRKNPSPDGKATPATVPKPAPEAPKS
jgi:hypothetical protein